jgi:hypothetical protein
MHRSSSVAMRALTLFFVPGVARRASLALIAGLSLCASLLPAAHADVFVREVSLGAGEASGSLTLPLGTQNYWVGYQNINVSPTTSDLNATSFIAYCADPFHYSSTSYHDYFNAASVHVTGGITGQPGDIQKLYDKYYGGTIGNNANAAAFQLALWEIGNDDKNLTSGVVQKNGSTNSTLVTNAQTLLSGFSSYAGPQLYNLTLYEVNWTVQGAAGQSYIVATPVPEPGTYAMLLAGLVVFGWVARRRLS